MRILRWLGYVVVAFVAAIALFLVAARFHDGPLAMVAGGPLEAGELVAVPPEPDWAFTRDIPTVELQLISPARSRTTWILEVDGRIYVPCAYPNNVIGRIWKQWPVEAERDGRAIVRVDGKRYARRLVRLREGDIVDKLTAELQRKYHAPATPAAVESGTLWLFELAPPQTTG